MNHEESGAAGVETSRVAVLTLELNLETFQLAIKGVIPGAELALAMLRMAEDEYKRVIQYAWLEAHRPRVVAGNGGFPHPAGRG